MMDPFEVWGDGSQVRDFVYVEDVVDAITQVVEKNPTARPYNVATGKGTTIYSGTVLPCITRLMSTGILMQSCTTSIRIMRLGLITRVTQGNSTPANSSALRYFAGADVGVVCRATERLIIEHRVSSWCASHRAAYGET